MILGLWIYLDIKQRENVKKLHNAKNTVTCLLLLLHNETTLWVLYKESRVEEEQNKKDYGSVNKAEFLIFLKL